jgi:hypothetical protein
MLAALDAVRGPAVRAAARLPWLADRERRAPALLALHAAAAAPLAALAPSLLLVVGPLVAGVPHVAEDLRQLILRRAPSRAWRLGLLAFCLLLLLPVGTRVEATVTAALLAAAGAPLLGVALAAAALAAPDLFRVVLAHAHNLVAIGLWLYLFRRRSRAAWMLAAAVLGIAALLASGALVPLLVGQGTLTIAGHSILNAADVLAPGVPGAAGVGIAMSFAFLQSVHYAVWVTCIPLDDLGPRSFRQGARRWRRDLGAVGYVAFVALVLLVPAAGLVAPLRTQEIYLSLVTFHAYLELVAWALIARRPMP